MASVNGIELQRHIHVTPEASQPASNAPTPEKAKAYNGWNWGAFSLSVPFGAIYGVSKCYLALIPLFGIVWAVVCGFCGSSWAFESGRFVSVKEFNSAMMQWNKIGVLAFAFIGVSIFTYVAIALLACWIFSLPSIDLLDLMTASS